MSDMYAIKGTTLTAIGDAIRDTVGLGAETFNFILERDTAQNTVYFTNSNMKHKLIISGVGTNISDARIFYITENDIRGAELFKTTFTASATEFTTELIVSCPAVAFAFATASFYADSIEITLTAIPLDENGNEYKYTPLEMADAVRALSQPPLEDIKIIKNGTYTPSEGVYGFNNVVVEVTGAVEVEPVILTGVQSYGCAGAMASSYIRLFGDTVSTTEITNTTYMFQNYTNDSIPFDINFATYGSHSMPYTFMGCYNLKTLPKLNNARPNTLSSFFQNCHRVRSIPDDFFDSWNLVNIENATSSYMGDCNAMFRACYSLRSIPLKIFKHMNKIVNYSYAYYYLGFAECYVLDELTNLPIPYTATYASNMFGNSFTSCGRLKNLTFEMNEDGTPLVKPWKSQTIELSMNTGYSPVGSYITNYNSGITADKEVKDDTTYQALKNDPDWFTTKVEYSRYNHDSAVATINSLPDCSATGTNTIKFKGAAGSLTDGGAINTLTEAEIAVATAKGWTVSFV